MTRGEAALCAGWIAVAALEAACAKRPPEATGDGGDAVATAAPSATRIATPTPTPALTLDADVDLIDAGPSTCRVILGPRQLPVRSPVSLAFRGAEVDAVLNEDGKPRVLSLPAGPVATNAAGTKETLDGVPAAGSTVGCAVAGDRVFCPDRGGNIHRTTRAGGDEHLAASARVGSRIAAGLLDGHPAFAYLASRETSEGWVTEAWLGVDDAAPVRVSEDGAGATAIALAQHGAGLLVLGVDARAALTAMHARVVTYTDKPVLAEDFVVFVGGPAERRTNPAVALGPTGAGLGLLPIAKDASDFGLALVRLDEPPHVDEPVGWSMYPNGLDPAPVAAAVGPHVSGGMVTWVARERPVNATPSSPKVLEIGEVRGTALDFVPRQIVAGTSGKVKDLSLVVDGHDALWLAWLDAAGAWLERLTCK